MTLRVALSVAEILVVVLVLAYFLRRLTQLLSHVGDNLETIAGGVEAVEQRCSLIGPGVEKVNGLLRASVANLEEAATGVEKVSPSGETRRALSGRR